MKCLIYILFIGFTSHAQFVYDATDGILDLNQVILDLPEGGLSLGNGCGGLGGGDFQILETPAGLELNGIPKLVLAWVHLTVNGPIADYGEILDIHDLIAQGRLELSCEPSNDYDNESTIVILDDTLTIPENYLDEIIMFPNPATDKVTIEGNNLKSIVCYSLQGKIIFKIKSPQEVNQIFLFNYNLGMYLVVIEDTNGNVDTKKLIII